MAVVMMYLSAAMCHKLDKLAFSGCGRAVPDSQVRQMLEAAFWKSVKGQESSDRMCYSNIVVHTWVQNRGRGLKSFVSAKAQGIKALYCLDKPQKPKHPSHSQHSLAAG